MPRDSAEARGTNPPRDEWLPGFCVMCMQGDCGLRVHMRDGVVVNIEGNPDSPTNQGRVCPRAISAIIGLYNPYRVKAPLKRTNPEKGPDVDPRWIEISWDEALETIATKLKKIRHEDPRKLVIWEGWGNVESLLMSVKEVEIATNYTQPGVIFAMAFGTRNVIGSHGPLCSIHYAANLVHGQHPEYISDLQHCNYLIAPGRTVGFNVANPASTRTLLEALERGMKLVVVDPRCSVEASKGYRWIPIRPGTELAFALAMIHTILYELKRYDDWFIKNRTNGPYLIQPDGYYVRDKSTGKPMIWDKTEDRAKTFDDESIQDYALEGAYVVDGVTAHPAFHLIRERMAEYTPEWAEKVTSVPAETTRTVTKEFVEHSMIGSTIMIDDFEFPFRPAQFAGSGRGAVSHKGGMFLDLAGKIINMLVGAVEVPGGITGNRNPFPNREILRPNEDGIVTPIMESIGVPFKFPPDHVDASEFYPNKHTGPHLAVKALLNPEEYRLPYQVEAFMICGANPIRSVCEKDTFIEAFRKIPFIFSISPVFDETTMMSDIVLPEPFFLEREMARFYLVTHQTLADDARGLSLVLGRKPVKQLFDTKLCDEILIEIAERIGILRGPGGLNDIINKTFGFKEKHQLDLRKKYSIREIMDRRIKVIFGDEYSFQYLLEHGEIHKHVTPGKLGYNYYYWPRNGTRHPIYLEHLKSTGDKLRENLQEHHIDIPGWKNSDEFFAYFQAIPYWIPNAEFEAPPEYDLWAVNWKTHLMPFGTGDTQENAWLHELAENDPYEMRIHINRATALEKGVKDNDLIWVESRYGKVKGTARLTELMHPEVVGIPACYGSGTLLMNPVAKKGTHFNRLLTMKEDVALDPISGSIDIGPRVKIYKA